MSALQFITSIPQNAYTGTGCFVGVSTLAKGIRALGEEVNFITPAGRFPYYPVRRVLFNQLLKFHKFPSGTVTVGIDADGYAIAGRKSVRHIASIKGVIGDVLPYENGLEKQEVSFYARLERLHAERANIVTTSSQYSADRLQELYGIPNVVVIPEPIDLDKWNGLLEASPPRPANAPFTVLCVCRFYPRKRVSMLLQAAAQLRSKIPELEVRIVGAGPEATRLHSLSRELDLGRTVTWLGNRPAPELAAEYRRAHVFCLPSIQEGFGIVFMEAMAAGLPIVAANASAVPEVVGHGLLVEPGSVEAFATAIEKLYHDGTIRESLGSAAKQHVERFEMKRVARQFLDLVKRVA